MSRLFAAQLPIYHPSEEEKTDPKLYAANVRELLLREGGFKPSNSSLVECRAYIALMEGRKPPAKSQAALALDSSHANGAQLADSKLAEAEASGTDAAGVSSSGAKKFE